MKAAAVSAGGLLSTVAAVGWPALAGLGLLALLTVATFCWTVANPHRTRNAVALITAARARSPRRRSTRA